MHVIETISLFGAYLLGILLAMWIKINDINNMVDQLTFKKTFVLFFQKEWRSYGFSVTFGLAYALMHDEWIQLLTTTNIAPDKLIDIMGALPMVASFLLGVITQYCGYKFWLGKLEKLFRNQVDITNNKN